MFKQNKTNFRLRIAQILGRSLKFVFLLVALTGVFLYTRVGSAPRVEAATSSYLNFQARLLGSSGAIVPDGTYNVEFKIFNASSSSGSSQGSCAGDAACQWTETRTAANKVTVKSGYLSVYLGQVTALPNINWDQDLYLTMNIGGTSGPTWDGEMTPRLKLTAVPYAFAAGQLAKASGGNTGVLQFGAITSNPVIDIPDASGTVCLQGASACGFATGNGTAFLQGGNNFGGNTGGTIGTTNNGDLNIITNNTTKLTVSAAGNLTFNQSSTIGIVSAGTASTLSLVGGTATASNNNGGDITLQGGTPAGSGNYGNVSLNAGGGNVGIGDATPTYLLTVGNGDLFGVQADGSLIWEGSSADVVETTFGVTNPTSGDQTYLLPDAGSAGTYTICTSANNCAGLGNFINNSTNVQATANFAIQSAAAGSIGGVIRGATSQTADLLQFQNATPSAIAGITSSGRLYYKDSGFTGLIDQGTLTGSQTYTLPNASGTICLTSGNCSGVGGNGDILNNGQNGPITIGTNNNTTLTLETNNTPQITILNSGNVGVGTIAPSGLLQVTQGTTGFGTVATNGTTTLTGTNTQFLNTFKAGDSITVSGETVRTIATVTSNTNLSVTVAFSTTASGLSYTLTGGDRLTVLGNGNVGIGTSTPLSKLDVNGGLAVGDYAGTNAAPIGGLIVAGNVGIGTEAPQARLQVSDNNKFSTTTFAPSASLVNFSLLTTAVGAANSGPVIGFSGDINSGGGQWLFGAIKGAKETNTPADTAGYLSFFTSPTGSANAVERLRITSTGTVGIGTSNPQSSMVRVEQTSATSSASAAYILNSSTTAGGYGLTVDNANTTGTGGAIRIIGVTGGNVRGLDITGITSGTGIVADSITTGTVLNANGITTGNGAILAGTALTTGSAIQINANAAAVTSAKYLDISGTTTVAITQNFTGSYINVAPTRIMTAAATRNDSGNLLNLTPAYSITGTNASNYTISGILGNINRSATINDANATFAYASTAAALSIQSNITCTAGSCSDASNILSLAQNFATSTGTVINATGAGTGNLAVLDATNASANGASIDVQSNSSSQYALDVRSNNGTSRLYVRADGNVGIGTTSPAAQLHVIGTNGTNGGTGTAGTNGLTVVAGNGGTSSTNSTAGGGGGTLSLTAGNGGNASGLTSAGGPAGTIALTSGNAGSSTNVTGINGGAIIVTSGNGGATTGSNANSNGGAITLQGGAAGTGGSGTAGSIGNVILQSSGGKVAIGTSGTPSQLLSIGGTTGNVTIDTSGNLILGASAGSGTLLTNNGATVNATLALGDFATGGAIGTAAATVDKYTSVSIAQTTAGQTLTLPTPTANTAYGRMLYLSNIGTTSFTILGTTLNNGSTATLVWANTNGAASWQFAGADGSAILNQNSTDQSANFRITGTGRANTSFTTPLVDAIGAGTLGVGTVTTGNLTIGNATAGGSNSTTVQAATGGLTVQTAVSQASGNTGAIIIQTGAANTGSNNTSGGITLQSGNATGGNASSGSISIDVGSKTGTGTAGSITLGTGTNVPAAITISKTGGATTNINGNLTLGASAGSGTLLTNNGATVNTTLAVINDSDGGALGGTPGTPMTAAQSVDIYTSISVNQTTAGQTITLPTPTASTAYGRLLYISNIGTASFGLLNSTLNAGATATLMWANTNGGASWVFAGADGTSINNQNAAQQSANFWISGTGRADTGLQSPNLERASSGTLSIGTTSNTTALTIGSSNAVGASALILESGASSTMTIGNSAVARTINIGNVAAAQTITLGSTNTTSTSAIQGGTGATAVTIQTGSGGTISIGTAAASTINVGTGAFAHTIVIGTDSTTTQGITIGSSSASSTTAIQGGTGASAVSIQATSGGTISVGSAAASTINVGTGAFAHTIAIGTDGTTTQGISIGSLSASSSLALQGGTGSSAVSIQSGTSGTISIGSASANTVNIATGAFAHTIAIATDGSTTQDLTLGSTSASSTTSINGGTGASAVTINTGANGVVNIGDNAVNKTIDIGGVDSSGSDTINIATNGTASDAVTIGSNNSASTVKLQGGTASNLWVRDTGVGINTGASTVTGDISFGSGARTINVLASGAGTAGGNLTVAAGNSGTGAVNGGDLILQGGATGGSGTTGSVIVKANGTNSASVFVVQSSAAADTLLTIDTTTTNKIKVGNSTGTGTATTVLQLDNATTAPFAAPNATYLGSMYYDSTLGRVQCFEADGWGSCGTQNNAVTLTPEFAGAVLTGDGTNNTGTMTSDFCSGASHLNIPSSNNPCGASEERNYYSWTAQATNDYDVWMRYQVPSDFSSWDTTPIQFAGWRSSSSAGNSVTMTIYKADGTVCGTATAIANTTTWTNTTYTTPCTPTAGSILTFRITLSVGVSNEIARIGDITLNYVSK